ncbi:hypothetical protein EGW08_006515 [Elysia chlorotica]|uniref:6-phosphofructokinase n=1 Tax=Elysia chlorotica TaxID=188477 RepID=A0A433TVW1_ELYCH|nr:hypothetical protein EGW08_006515 [Elysia chlorotica]
MPVIKPEPRPGDRLSLGEQIRRQKKQLSYDQNTTVIPIDNNSWGSSTSNETICVGEWAGNVIGVFTSGGDAQGMNAAVRAIVRVGIFLGCKVYYIKEGYQGMVDGGDNIQLATWESTSSTIHMGGTLIGSARCLDFRERPGRLKAAKNLVELGITNLIAIGGDGSLTGANLFRQEWPGLLRELVDTNQITMDRLTTCSHLNIVGLVGSIDNDFCGTDMTIGVDSALHRIIESVDEIMTTAVSHKRAFVLEIMGRMCGYLPLVAGISSEATMVFIPEDPPEGDWRQGLCDHIKESSKTDARRTHIVLVAEGAIDRFGNIIKCSDVQKVLTERMNMDVRVTVLGHVQRGGRASAFDRIIGTRMGTEAVLALMDAGPETPACVIVLHGIDIVRTPLMKAVETTKLVGQKMSELNFDEVVNLRGRFTHLPSVSPLWTHVRQACNASCSLPMQKILRVAMIHNGQPACGMNAAARGFVGMCISNGYQPLFIYESWRGLIEDKVEAIEWSQTQYYTSAGGSKLGTSPETAEEVGVCQIASKLHEHNISALIIVGGFEAFKSAYDFLLHRDRYPELCIPINVIPATIANNVPGCKLSLGCDTAMNNICKACDALKMSANSLQKVVYVVETGGDNCGYLAMLSALASGADACFIMEEDFGIRDIFNVCKQLKHKLKFSGVKQGLVLRNENASTNLTTDFIYRVLNEEGKPNFSARKTVLGYTQTGHTASPYDRCQGIKAGCRATAWVLLTLSQCSQGGKVFTNSPSTITVTTQTSGQESYMSVENLALRTDFENHLPKDQWWLKLGKLLSILSWPLSNPEVEGFFYRHSV